MRLQDVYEPEANAPLRFDSMTYVYSDMPETAFVSEVWIGLLNVEMPALNATLPQFGATWGAQDIGERRVHHIWSMRASSMPMVTAWRLNKLRFGLVST